MLVFCKNCNIEFEKQKSQIKENNFCSRSCANTFNNKIKPKRKLSRKCETCQKPIRSNVKYCSPECNPNTPDWSKRLLHECSKRAIYDHARLFYKNSNKPQICINPTCNYTNHFEVCHIKPISEFGINTPITEVNHIDNLIALCPNCHWDLDHGLLKL